MTKILVIGKNSFIARSIVPYLQAFSHQVTAFSHQEFDITNYAQVFDILGHNYYDFVIDCAWAGTNKYMDVPQSKPDFCDNIRGIENLLFWNHLYGKLIFLNSGASFDKNHHIYDRLEADYRTIPQDEYGFGKFLAYKRFRDNNKIINLNIYNVFGPKEWESRFIKTCIRNCLGNEQIYIPNDCFFSFFYMKDLSIIINRLIQNPPNLFFDLNCVYNNKWLLSEVAQMIKNKIGSKSDIIVGKDWGMNYDGNGVKLERMGLNLIGLNAGLDETIKVLND